MKKLLLAAVVALPVFLTGCASVMRDCTRSGRSTTRIRRASGVRAGGGGPGSGTAPGAQSEKRSRMREITSAASTSPDTEKMALLGSATRSWKAWAVGASKRATVSGVPLTGRPKRCPS